MKKKLLIISKDQFGYLTDTYKYCQYLKNEYSITYFCLDWGKPKIDSEDINVILINLKSGMFYLFFHFAREIIKHISTNKYDIIFCVYFRFCFLLSFFTDKTKIILDIRTGNVTKYKLKRILSDFELKFNSFFFKRITIISEGLAQKLGITEYKMLPLGADKVVDMFNDEKRLKLLYIGTFNNRRLKDTILGYSKFLKQNSGEIESSYTIIGDGTISEKRELVEAIKVEGLDDKVKLLGRINYNELSKYLSTHNVGISYVPITDYYNFQPPTKTYEYLINGLICIGTATYENKRIINETNGVLCSDEPDSFSNALNKVKGNLNSYNKEEIFKSVSMYTWKEISKLIFKPILEGKLNINK